MKSYPAKMDPSNTQVWNCENAFDFVCPRQWESLGKTEDPSVRFCGVCSENVYLCDTPLEFVTQGNLGRCVAIPANVKPCQTANPHTMGRVAASTERQWQQTCEYVKEWWSGVLANEPTFNREEIDEIVRKLNAM